MNLTPSFRAIKGTKNGVNSLSPWHINYLGGDWKEATQCMNGGSNGWDAMHGAWVEFIRTHRAPWPAWSADGVAMIFDTDSGPRPAFPHVPQHY